MISGPTRFNIIFITPGYAEAADAVTFDLAHGAVHHYSQASFCVIVLGDNHRTFEEILA